MNLFGISLERIAAYVAVVDAGSFTAAAEHLDMTKSAVSSAVALLERELGIQLLQRSTRKLSITEAGDTFLADCRALLVQAGMVVERARTGRAQPTGTLRLTSPQDSASMIAPWIAAYREKFPGMRIDYVATDQSVDLIADRFDLAIRVGPMRDSRLRAVKLAERELWVITSEIYLARRGVPRKPENLADHEWIAMSILPHPWTEEFTLKSGRLIRVRMRGAISVSSASAVRSLVEVGLGVSTLPDGNVRAEVEAGRLTRLFPDCTLKKLFLHAVYPGSREPPAKTRTFIDVAKGILSQ